MNNFINQLGMNIPDIAENRAIKLFTKEFGHDIISRYKKFKEEVAELNDAINDHQIIGSQESLEHLLDEFSDVQGTFTHLASLFGLYQRKMLHNCIDKVINRKTNPDYKRFSSDDFPIGIQTRDNNIHK